MTLEAGRSKPSHPKFWGLSRKQAELAAKLALLVIPLF